MGITITPRKGCWIQYQLKLNNITQEAVAQKAGCTRKMVSHFLRGRKNSERVKQALITVLGYSSFEAMIAASRRQEEAI